MAKASTILQAVSDLMVLSLSLVEAEGEDLEAATVTGRGPTAARFWVDVQSSDSGKMRQRGVIRVEHSVMISVLMQVAPRAKFDGVKSALDLEGKIIDTMMVQASFASQRILWGGTKRSFVSEGKAYRFDISFSIEDTYTIGSSL